MEKSFRIGRLNTGHARPATVTAVVKLNEGRLSITALAQRPGAKDWDAGGQMLASLEGPEFQPKYGWTGERIEQFLKVWRGWHLNDMRAGCEHQRDAGWEQVPIDPSKSLDAYGYHFEGQRSPSHNMLGWITPDEHPAGLLTRECPVCGYRYGSAWLREELPSWVVAYVESLPNSEGNRQ